MKLILIGLALSLAVSLVPSDYFVDGCLAKNSCSKSVVRWLSLGEPLRWFTVVITTPDLDSGGFYVDKTYLAVDVVTNFLLGAVMVEIGRKISIKWNIKNVMWVSFFLVVLLVALLGFKNDLFGLVPRRFFPLNDPTGTYRISILYAVPGIPESAIYALEYWSDRGLTARQTVRIDNPPQNIRDFSGKEIRVSGRFVFERGLRGRCTTFPCETEEYPSVILTKIEAI